MHTMKHSLPKLLLTFTLFSLLTTSVMADTLIDRIVAIVNNDVILKSELSEQMLTQQQTMKQQGIPIPDIDTLQQKVLDSLILEKLQLERAKQLGIEIPDEYITEQLESIAQQNNMSLVALRKRLNLENPNGFDALRQQIKTQAIIQKVREAEVLSQIHVSESEINNLINRQALNNTQESLHLGHILIELPNSPTPQQRQAALEKAQYIHQQLKKGADFQQLAVQHSDGNNALKGGSLGWLKRPEIPSFFNDAIAELSPGDISPVIQSPNGFHIVKLIEQKTTLPSHNTQLYHLHRFIFPSDQTLQTTPPKELVERVASIQNLDDFNALKTFFPEIPKSINQQSDLGWRPLSELPPALQEKVQTLSPNQALEPLPTQQGWMVLFLEELKTTTPEPNALKQQAMQEIRMRKANELFERWLQRLKDEAFIEIKLNDYE